MDEQYSVSLTRMARGRSARLAIVPSRTSEAAGAEPLYFTATSRRWIASTSGLCRPSSCPAVRRRLATPSLPTLTLVLADIKMLILHEHRHDDGIRNFFLDVWELLVKVRIAHAGTEMHGS